MYETITDARRKLQIPLLGEIDFKESEVILFPAGIIGFEDQTDFVIAQQEAFEPIRWLISVNDPSIVLPIIDPFIVMKQYNPRPKLEELSSIGLTEIRRAVVFAVVTIMKDLNNVSINLRGPIVINTVRKLGRQVILVDSDYLLKYPINIIK